MLNTLKETLRNLRASPLQSFLSVLGVIIGVAALTAMLSMIDGLETYAANQIEERGDMKTISVQAVESYQIDGISQAYDSIVRLDEEIARALVADLPHADAYELRMSDRALGATASGEQLGIYFQASTLPFIGDREMVAGRDLEARDDGERLAVVNENLAARLLAPFERIEQAVGKRFLLFDSLTVVGVITANNRQTLNVELPLKTFYDLPFDNINALRLGVTVPAEEFVATTEDSIQTWFDAHYPEMKETVRTYSRGDMLARLAEGILVFRLVMGFLIGIAVVVGGVGVMNVLLMSIAERTPEIGIRKAVGATRKSIIRQFLSEAIIISVLGSLIGVVLGLIIAFGAVPIFNYFVEGLDFQAGFSLTTLTIISVVAVLIGVVFGTYPARKAAGLDPVEAIRR